MSDHDRPTHSPGEGRNTDLVTLLLSRVLSAVAWVDRVVIRSVAAFILLLLAVCVTLDAALRYLLHNSFLWLPDLVGVWLMPALVFGSLSAASAAGAHVRVDLLITRMPGRVGTAVDRVSSGVIAVVFGVITWQTAIQADHSWSLLHGGTQWLTSSALGYTLTAVGCGWACLRMLLMVALGVPRAVDAGDTA